jgi:hypothetical protein
LFGDLMSQIRIIRADRSLLLSILGNTYFWFLAALLQYNIKFYSDKVLHATEFQGSCLQAALAIGIAGYLLWRILRRKSRKHRHRRPELLKAIGAGAGVVLLTALIIFLIQPGSSSSTTPTPAGVQTPVSSVPSESSLPTGSTPSGSTGSTPSSTPSGATGSTVTIGSSPTASSTTLPQP